VQKALFKENLCAPSFLVCAHLRTLEGTLSAVTQLDGRARKPFTHFIPTNTTRVESRNTQV